MMAVTAAILTTIGGVPYDEASFLASCRQSPDVFIEFMLSVKQAQVHEDFQNHLTTYDNCYSELHRGIGKTTQVVGRVAWEIGNNPNLRIKYVQQTDDEARKTSGLIRDMIESDDYQRIFPEIEPDMDSWGKEAFKVKRDKWSRDATVEAKGIGGRAGGRADILVADDVCDLRNAIQQAAERAKVKDSWATNWLPMLDQSTDRKPRVWKVGTPYHVSDITEDWRQQHRSDGSLFRKPVMGLTSPWAEAYTPEVLEKLRTQLGPIAFGRAYLLNPVTSEMLVFPQNWLDHTMYERIPADAGPGVWECSFDWAYTDARSGDKLKDLNDPDYSVCLIGFRTESGHLYIEDMVRMRAALPDFGRTAIDRCYQHGVKHGVGEGNGPQRETVRSINAMSPFPIAALERNRDKMTRATACQPFVQGARFHIKGMRDAVTGAWRPIPTLEPLYNEMTTFPTGDHDDCVDCAIDLIGSDAIHRTERLFNEDTTRRTHPKRTAGYIYGHPPEQYE